MLTISDVRSFVGNSAYFARGRIYADEGRVFSVKESSAPDGEMILTGRVGGNGEVYDVTVCFDAASLHECSCNCPAFARTKMCKHVAALLITYAEGEEGLSARREEARA